jgi:hypothetical protein
MPTNINEVIQSQYLSALAMLKQAIIKCPQSAWDAPRDKDGSWFKAYHALYFAHLYLQTTRKDFVRWKGHGKPITTPPLSKKDVLDYLAFVELEVIRRLPLTNLEGQDSGFHSIRVNKLELQFVNIRHIQQHTGELYERLGTRSNIQLAWAESRHRRKSSPRRAA